jgi:hypothetical protein
MANHDDQITLQEPDNAAPPHALRPFGAAALMPSGGVVQQ